MSSIDPVLIVAKRKGMKGHTSIGDAIRSGLETLGIPVHICRWTQLCDLDDVLFRNRPRGRCLVTRGGYHEAKAVLLTLALHSLTNDSESGARLVGAGPMFSQSAVRSLCLSIHRGVPQATEWLFSSPSGPRPSPETVRSARAAFRMGWHNARFSDSADSNPAPDEVDERGLLLEFANDYPEAPLVQSILGDPARAVCRQLTEMESFSDAAPDLERACRAVSRHLAG